MRGPSPNWSNFFMALASNLIYGIHIRRLGVRIYNKWLYLSVISCYQTYYNIFCSFMRIWEKRVNFIIMMSVFLSTNFRPDDTSNPMDVFRHPSVNSGRVLVAAEFPKRRDSHLRVHVRMMNVFDLKWTSGIALRIEKRFFLFFIVYLGIIFLAYSTRFFKIKITLHDNTRCIKKYYAF